MKIKARRCPWRELWNTLHERFTAAPQTATPSTSTCNQTLFRAGMPDPHAVARELLRTSFRHGESKTLRFFKELWWRWNGQCYHSLLPKEALALVNNKLREVFDAQAPDVRVNVNLVANVLQALSGECLVGECDPPVWLGKTPRPSDGDLLPMKNGLLDLKELVEGHPEKALLPQTPDWFTLTSWHYAFNPTATCPQWERCLETILPGEKERAFLQEFVGYLLTHDTSLHIFLIFAGDGANGKSTFTEVLTQMLGPDNVTHVGLERFNDRFALARTIGKLANIVSEIGAVRGMVEGVLKAIVGGDRITVEFKNQTPFDAKPTVRLLFATNVLPELDDRSDGVWRRVQILPFNVTIPKEKQDPHLARRICENELPGVFNWAVTGLRRLRQQGRFTVSEAAQQAVREHRLACNPERQFLDECCTLSPDHSERCDLVYARYRTWLQGRRATPVTQTVFGREVHRVFPAVRRRQTRLKDGGREYRYVGLRLRLEAL